MFKGTAASPGIVLGKALVLEHNELVIEKKSISDVDKEIERLNDAVAISKAELEKVRDVKNVNPLALVVGSKRNHYDKEKGRVEYTFVEILNKSLIQRNNLTIEFSLLKDKNILSVYAEMILQI